MSHSTSGRPTDAEYITNWPAVFCFVVTIVIVLGVSVAGLLVNASSRLTAGARANAVQDVLTESQLAPQPRTSGKSDIAPTATDLAAAEQANAHMIEDSRSMEAVSSTPPLPAPATQAFRNDPPTNSLARTSLASTSLSDTAESNSPPATIDDGADWLPRYEFQFLNGLKEHSVELDLDTVPGTSLAILSGPAAMDDGESEISTDSVPAARIRQRLLAERSDLSGLPFRSESQCRMNPEDVRVMSRISTLINGAMSRTNRLNRGEATSELLMAREADFKAVRNSTAWGQPDSVATAVQMLQVEKLPLRLELVAALSSMDAPSASEALADRAMFDAAEEVRTAAIEALTHRPADEYRHRLLAGLRYPWPTAAFLAAQAMVAQNDTGAVRQLVDLLDEADPKAPYMNDDGKLMQNELVRVNHLRNCVLCHAPSLADADPIRGAVPTPGQPIPQAYYNSHEGSFVRADIVYLKQDFSAMHQVENAAPWPPLQRFDYLVRVRELTPEEVAAEQERRAGIPSGQAIAEAPSYPQRDAVLLALRALTKRDAGELSESWRTELSNWAEAE